MCKICSATVWNVNPPAIHSSEWIKRHLHQASVYFCQLFQCHDRCKLNQSQGNTVQFFFINRISRTQVNSPFLVYHLIMFPSFPCTWNCFVEELRKSGKNASNYLLIPSNIKENLKCSKTKPESLWSSLHTLIQFSTRRRPFPDDIYSTLNVC